MLRYVAFVWNEEDVQQTRSVGAWGRELLANSAEWEEVTAGAGFAVYCRGHRHGSGSAHKLPNGRGVIVGTLFEQHSSPHDDSLPRLAMFGARESDQLLKTGGQYLISAYWGWYVAFIRDPRKRVCWIVRGPMSDLPCFHVVHGGVNIFCSWIDDCTQFGVPLSVNRTFLAAQVTFGSSIRIGESALNEVTAIERGECVEIAAEVATRKVYWDPCTVSKTHWLTHAESAAGALRATASSCVAAWASRHEAVLVRLSGGFDSSVVACLLRNAPTRPKVTCFNYFVTGPLGDERHFARLAAKHAGFELIEREWGHHGDLSIVASVARTAAPILDFTDWQEHGWERELAAQHRATAIFMGSLGDVLFEISPGASPAADFIHRRGFRPSLGRVILDSALRQRISVWEVLKRTMEDLRHSRAMKTWNPYSMSDDDNRRLGPGVILTCDDATQELSNKIGGFAHRWLQSVDKIPPGKLWMITALCVEAFYEAHYRDATDAVLLAPFMSQPLTELCLRIPTFLNVKGGWDRAIARLAFRKDMPQQIIRRMTKGSPDFWLRQVVNRNEHFIRSFLLGGALVADRIVDPHKLERVLPGSVTKAVCDGGTIMNLLYTEAWLRRWSERRWQAAA